MFWLRRSWFLCQFLSELGFVGRVTDSEERIQNVSWFAFQGRIIPEHLFKQRLIHFVLHQKRAQTNWRQEIKSSKTISMLQQFSFLHYNHFRMSLAYYGIKLLNSYCSWLYFQDVKVINRKNIPQEGPIIIYGNHNNQFVDGVLLMNIVDRPVSFIAAAVSCRRVFLGALIRNSGAIPVERPQDAARKGVGKIVSLRDRTIRGVGCNFILNLKKDELVVFGALGEMRVIQVVSNDQILVDSLKQFEGESDYKVIPKLEFAQMYENVWGALRDGKCIGIFPEGGSHDRKQLLPLKAGICIMALGAMQKYKVPVKIIPCGFNYFNPEKFRSQVIVEFGPAYTIDQQLLELYRVNKKQAISHLLEDLQQMLKAVTTEIKSYNELSTLFMCRDLYTLNSMRKLTVEEEIQLNRRFAKGYHLMASKPQHRELHDRLVQFSEFLSLNDIQLKKEPYLDHVLADIVRFVWQFSKCILMSVFALPGVVMMGPTTKLVAYLAEKQRIRCLKTSKVKVHGNDVVGSYKIMLGMVMLPITAAVHSLILYWALRKYTKFTPKNIRNMAICLFALQPIYGLLFVKSYDSFKVAWKRLKFIFVRLFKRGTYETFNREKEHLNRAVLRMVNELGEEVVPDFESNRILRRTSVEADSLSKLYVFSEPDQPEQ